MSITIDVIYENGILRPTQPLPLEEHQRVRVTVHTKTNWVQETYGILGWQGSTELAEQFALDPELDFPARGGAMIFADLVAGDHVFVDANTLTYQFQPHLILGPPCSQLLQRIENQELLGFTSVHVLAEVAHRLMTIQACTLNNWPFAGVGNRLRNHPAEVCRLTVFRFAIERILQSNLQVLTVSPAMLAVAVVLSQQIGLLTNDALIVAIMQQHGLTKLASHDTDFDCVPGLIRYAPA